MNRRHDDADEPRIPPPPKLPTERTPGMDTLPRTRPDRERLSEKELLLSLHDRLDDLDRWRGANDQRLRDGDERFKSIQQDVSVLIHWCREMALTVARRPDIVEEVDRHLAAKSHGNGFDRDEPTNPDGDG